MGKNGRHWFNNEKTLRKHRICTVARDGKGGKPHLSNLHNHITGCKAGIFFSVI